MFRRRKVLKLAQKKDLERWVKLLISINRRREDKQIIAIIKFLEEKLKRFEVEAKVKQEQKEALKSMMEAIENFSAAEAAIFKKVV